MNLLDRHVDRQNMAELLYMCMFDVVSEVGPRLLFGMLLLSSQAH